MTTKGSAQIDVSSGAPTCCTNQSTRRSVSSWWSLFLLCSSGLWSRANAQSSYANVTLTANDGDLSVVVYLPHGIKQGEPTYYMSTRLDHGSMIGKIQRTSKDSKGKKTMHTLYGTRNWRVPHDPYWPESGFGLASEFGVGDDGAFCNWRCGWFGVNEVTNGVLGYQGAAPGDSFLKIGVGELRKGSCTACDSTDDFKFNSPYEFASRPVWSLTENKGENSITLAHEAVLNENGYQLQKEIKLEKDTLLIKNTLTNIGRIPFATAWYSHHFFTCDSKAVGRGYNVDLDVTARKPGKPIFEEPGTWFWSSPIESYASILPTNDQVSVEMQRGVEQDVRIKAEFVKDEHSKGSFVLRSCGTRIEESIPEVGTEGGVSMYAFNLYIESGTFSPEPQIYMHLWPGQSSTWTQKLEFSDWDPDDDPTAIPEAAFSWFGLKKVLAASEGEGSRFDGTFVLFVAVTIMMTYSIHWGWRRRRSQSREHYDPIPEL